jgi:hypothetical protein
MELDCFTLAEAFSEYTASIKKCVLVFTPSWKYSTDIDLINAAWDYYSDKLPPEIFYTIKYSDWGFIKYPHFDAAVQDADMYFPYKSVIDSVNPKFHIDCMIYDEEGKLAWTNEL